ncbi:hypothetical protein BH11PSE3_BH11PSE3_22920 [soil metagenome]
MTIDRERLIRLLRMTESDSEAEVLVAVRKTNQLLRANDVDWSDVILPAPAPAPAPAAQAQAYAEAQARANAQVLRPPPMDWTQASRAGFERSDNIRRAVRQEFPITLAFFPLWIAAELMAIFFPNTYWNKNGKRVVAAFWSLCWLGLLAWLGAGAYLLTTVGK